MAQPLQPRRTTMPTSLFRVVVASTLVLQVLFALSMLVVPLALSCRLPTLAPDGGRDLFAHAIESASSSLFLAWSLRTALRWLPTQPSHSISLALGVGTLFVARGMLGILLTSFAAFDVVNGVALVVVAGALWRARARTPV